MTAEIQKLSQSDFTIDIEGNASIPSFQALPAPEIKIVSIQFIISNQ
jgi:hypothetical protein